MNKWILSCMVSLSKNDTSVAAHFDRKNFEKVFVNRKEFCIFTM